MTDSSAAPESAIKVPGHYWAVAIVSLLWNAFGAYLYTMVNLGDEQLLTQAPPAMQEYIANMPTWAHAMWAFGIWGSFLGSILLLVRSRYAVPSFLVSLLGAIGSFGAQARAGVLQPAEPAMILLVIAFLLWFSRRSQRSGLLR